MDGPTDTVTRQWFDDGNPRSLGDALHLPPDVPDPTTRLSDSDRTRESSLAARDEFALQGGARADPYSHGRIRDVSTSFSCDIEGNEVSWRDDTV